jgi:hypothetical protein
MDSVEIPVADREGDEVDLGTSGQVGMKIESLTKVKVGSEHMGVMGEDEVHIATQAKDIISS